MDKAEMRFRAALEIFIHTISTDMKKHHAVEEAVKTADMLLDQLDKDDYMSLQIKALNEKNKTEIR